jgi:hypothetical protein
LLLFSLLLSVSLVKFFLNLHENSASEMFFVGEKREEKKRLKKREN